MPPCTEGCLRRSVLVVGRIPLQEKHLRPILDQKQQLGCNSLRRNVLAPRTNSARRKHRRRRDAHTLDSQARHLVEFPPTAAKPTVRRVRIQADRASADLAAVPRPSARLGRKPSVAHDVNPRLSKVLTPRLDACRVVERPHRSSVAPSQTTVAPVVSGSSGDRSTATGASTGSPASPARR